MTWNRLKAQWPNTPDLPAMVWDPHHDSSDGLSFGREELLAWLREAEGTMRENEDSVGGSDDSGTGQEPFDVQDN